MNTPAARIANQPKPDLREQLTQALANIDVLKKHIEEMGTAFNNNAAAYYEGYQMQEMWMVINRRVMNDMIRGEVLAIEVEYAEGLRPVDLPNQALHTNVDYQAYKEQYIAMIGFIAFLSAHRHSEYFEEEKPLVQLATEADLRIIDFGGDVQSKAS